RGALRIHGPGEGMAPRGGDTVAREDRVAEAAALAVLAHHVHAVALDARVAGEERPQLGELVTLVVALEPREVVRDLLHAEDVEVRDRPRGLHDAREVDAAVEAAAPLDVPGEELQARNRWFGVRVPESCQIRGPDSVGTTGGTHGPTLDFPRDALHEPHRRR